MDLTVALSPQERRIQTQHAEWSGEVVRAARPVCTPEDLMCLTVCDLERDWGKPASTEGEKKAQSCQCSVAGSPVKMAKDTKWPSKDAKGLLS